MSTAKVTISLDSKIPLYWVAVDDSDVLDPPSKKKTISLTVDKEHYLSWWFAGDRGATFKISLDAESGYKILAIGTLPVDRSISLDHFHSADTLRFYVVKK